MLKRNTKSFRGTRPRGSKSAPSRIDLTVTRPPFQFRWAAAISESEWACYRDAMEAVRNAGVPFMLGGGFAGATYTGRWRDTKDIDFYILPADRERAVDALRSAGFEDYFDRLPYDRKWIARNTRGDVIVDIIWAMANQRARVDQVWFERAHSLTLRNQTLMVVPPEEFIWCKLYIMQRDHCDWTDVFNVLFAHGPQVDWDHLIGRLGDDVPLLRGLLSVFAWLCPARARELPGSLWRFLNLQPPPASASTAVRTDRVRYLDSRYWFVGSEEDADKLQV